jgi:hypothetical protein
MYLCGLVVCFVLLDGKCLQLFCAGDLLNDGGCSSLLRLCWNVEWFGGLEVVLNWSEVPPNVAISEEELSGFAHELKLLEEDLNCFKATAVAHRCKQHFYSIQNATTHQAVLKAISCVTGLVV